MALYCHLGISMETDLDRKENFRPIETITQNMASRLLHTVLGPWSATTSRAEGNAEMRNFRSGAEEMDRKTIALAARKSIPQFHD